MLKISVCIPCIDKHVPLLDRCLSSIYNQTLLPYEVIISISSIVDIQKTKETIDNLVKKYSHRLRIIHIIFTPEKRYAGENRNIAIEQATGDIISFIDADDSMYINRLNIINTMFTVFPRCMGILHWFNENPLDISEEDVADTYRDEFICDYTHHEELHFGHPSFRKHIFNTLRYSDEPRGQDFEFIESILPMYREKILVYKSPLTYYMSNDSTFYKSF